MQEHPPSADDYVPGALARAYHKQKTGEIKVSDIATVQLNPLPLHLQETVREHAVQAPMRRLALPERVQSHLPIGPDGRPFLVAVSDLSTGDILKVIVKRFYAEEHVYPTMLFLNSRRWEEYGIWVRRFFPDPHSDLSIELFCGSDIEEKYDVIARGKEVHRVRRRN